MFQLLQYIRYWLQKVDEHALHSPFLFDLYTEVVKGPDLALEELDALRASLLSNHTFLDFKELGAGSRISNSSQRKTSQIARHVSTPKKFSMLLFRLIQKIEPEVILELGTSLGLNTLYMSRASADSQIHTFEGVHSVADLAESHFQSLGANNITLHRGNIDETLPLWVGSQPKIDLVYMDANHRYQPTLHYFDWIKEKTHKDSVIIVDDIHWSKEMNRAWQEMISHPEVSLSIDLFEAGILFFDPVKSATKTNWVLDY